MYSKKRGNPRAMFVESFINHLASRDLVAGNFA
jgi:hypothetical protein